MTAQRRLRFGVWALVHGSRAAYGDPDEPYDASWQRNRALP
jgi:alkanesulfonate monooxygenase